MLAGKSVSFGFDGPKDDPDSPLLSLKAMVSASPILGPPPGV